MGSIHMELTAKGEALAAKIQKGNGTVPLEITRIVAASGRSPDPLSLGFLSELDIRQTARITRQESHGSRASVEAVLTNIGNPSAGEPPLAAGYELFRLGMGAIDPDEGEILYRVSQFENSAWVPPATEMGWTISLGWNFVVGNATHVTVQIDPLGMATVRQLEAHINDTVLAPGGVHGIRFRDRRLEVHDGNKWLTLLRHGNFRVADGALSHDLSYGGVEANGEGTGTLVFAEGFARSGGTGVILE